MELQTDEHLSDDQLLRYVSSPMPLSGAEKYIVEAHLGLCNSDCVERARGFRFLMSEWTAEAHGRAYRDLVVLFGVRFLETFLQSLRLLASVGPAPVLSAALACLRQPLEDLREKLPQLFTREDPLPSDRVISVRLHAVLEGIHMGVKETDSPSEVPFDQLRASAVVLEGQINEALERGEEPAVEAWLAAGLAYLTIGRSEESPPPAIRLFKEATERFPASPEAWILLGRAYFVYNQKTLGNDTVKAATERLSALRDPNAVP